MFVSSSRRSRARALRREGKSIREIAVEVGAAKSSVSNWVRDIALPESLQAALDARDPVRARRLTGSRAWSRLNREKRQAFQSRGRERARSGDALYIAGCMLFWAEGSKQPNQVVMTNSDDQVLRVFVEFLREHFGVASTRIKLTVNCYLGNGLSLREIEDHWLAVLTLPRSSLCPSVVNCQPRSSKGSHRVLRHGTARVAVGSTAIAQEIFGAIQEFAGFERPEWILSATERRRERRTLP